MGLELFTVSVIEGEKIDIKLNGNITNFIKVRTDLEKFTEVMTESFKNDNLNDICLRFLDFLYELEELENEN